MNLPIEADRAVPETLPASSRLSEPPFIRPEAVAPASPPPRAHSKLGLAGFALSLTGLFCGVALVGAAGYLNIVSHGRSDTMPLGLAAITLGAALVFGILLTALGLSIASLFAGAANRTFGVLGLTFSGVTLLGFVGLAVVARFGGHGPREPASRDTPAAPVAAWQPSAAASARPPDQVRPSADPGFVTQIADNDNVQVTIAGADGVAISAAVIRRLDSAIERKIAEVKTENPPTGLAKQFLIEVSIKRYGKADGGIPDLRALDLMFDVRVLPGGERVCYFGVGELGGPEQSDASLEMKAAIDAAKCLEDQRMWIRPVKVSPVPAEATPPLRGGDI
jgi:hypothetical protein